MPASSTNHRQRGSDYVNRVEEPDLLARGLRYANLGREGLAAQKQTRHSRHGLSLTVEVASLSHHVDFLNMTLDATGKLNRGAFKVSFLYDQISL